MAKAGLKDHPKFRRLVYILREPVPHVWGYLECLWMSGYQLRSDRIGDDIDVELAAEFQGEPGTLAKALVTSGFIDSKDGIYFIHDFWEHCPKYVRDAKGKSERRTADRQRTNADKRGQTRTNSGQCVDLAQDCDENADNERQNAVTAHKEKEKEKEKENTPLPPFESKVENAEPETQLSVDPVKADAMAKRIVQAYRTRIGTNGPFAAAQSAVVAAMDALPTATESDFQRSIDSYLAECEANGTERKFRIGAQRFFTGEWREYLSREPRSPPQKAITIESVAEINRHEAEVIERLMS